MTKKILIWIFISLFLAIIAGVIAFFLLKQPQEQNLIKIGATLPLSGDAAVWGKNTQEGIELALKEVNSSGGVLGRKIEVIYEDTQALPKQGVSAYQKLTTVDKVQAIIDDSISSVTLAMAPLAERNHVVILSTGATSPKISGIGKYIFRIWNSDAYEGELAAKYAFENLKLRAIAILYINNEYGKGLDVIFSSEFQKRGGKTVASESFTQNVTDMRTQLTKILAMKPEGLYLIGYPKEIPIAIKQAKELGLNVQLLGTVAMHDPQLIQTAGNAAEGLIFPYPKEPSGINLDQFKKSFINKYGKEPGITSDVGYDALKMICKAIEFAGSFSGVEIMNGLRELKNYPGVSGTMSFDENGDVHKPMGLKIIKDGRFVWIE